MENILKFLQRLQEAVGRGGRNPSPAPCTERRMIMALIKTIHNVGDKVWWVHCTSRVYEGTIEEINCCDYQGALYCIIASPSFKVNPFPNVHYGDVFKTKEEAKKYAKFQKRNRETLPMCMSCHYNEWLKQPAEG